MLGPDGKPTPGGAGYYRCALPAKALSDNGVETIVGRDIAPLPSGELILLDWDKEVHKDLDVIVSQRWMASDAAEHIRRAKSTGQVIVNDCDDWYDGLDPTNIAWFHSHPKINPEANRDHYRAVLGASSALTVSTPYLAGRLERLNPNVIVVPNAIDIERWKYRDAGTRPAVVGWVGAVGFRSRDLQELRGVLGPFCAKHGVPFHHSGHAPGHPRAAELMAFSPDLKVSNTGMSNIYGYPELFTRFSIGIVPLRRASFNDAKSNIKGLEYGAAGIPFVASPTPAYRELAEEGGGFTAQRPRDWTRHLERLLDPAERTAAGERARAASEIHDSARQWYVWRDAYQTLLAGV
jgi:glycosyltransferase involved in cell wall biosynthesis